MNDCIAVLVAGDFFYYKWRRFLVYIYLIFDFVLFNVLELRGYRDLIKIINVMNELEEIFENIDHYSRIICLSKIEFDHLVYN